MDLTRPEARVKPYVFPPEELVVFAFPVYAGRVPELLLPMLSKMKGEGGMALPVCVYGNRAYEDALLEAKTLLTAGGFQVIAAGAFIGEHSLSVKLAADGPMNPISGSPELLRNRSRRRSNPATGPSPVVKGNLPFRERMRRGNRSVR